MNDDKRLKFMRLNAINLGFNDLLIRNDVTVCETTTRTYSEFVTYLAVCNVVEWIPNW
jgi:hypothetical protein